MHARPHQQTLSIRVSESLREYLELSRQVIANDRDEPISISDVARLLLESAKSDRLDFRLEVAELQQSPTESLGQIRRKWQQHRVLSRAEWVLLAQYIRIACEELTGNPRLPGANSLAAVLEALLAVRTLRRDRGSDLDRHYLGLLASSEHVISNRRHSAPDVLPEVVSDLVRRLREPVHVKEAVLVGRAFFTALRDEVVGDALALDETLNPFMEQLFRMAARGHWVRHGRPVRLPGEYWPPCSLEPLTAGGFCAMPSASKDGDFELTLVMHDRGVTYPIGPYPEIQEFGAMLRQLEAGQVWNGALFHG